MLRVTSLMIGWLVRDVQSIAWQFFGATSRGFSRSGDLFGFPEVSKYCGIFKLNAEPAAVNMGFNGVREARECGMTWPLCALYSSRRWWCLYGERKFEISVVRIELTFSFESNLNYWARVFLELVPSLRDQEPESQILRCFVRRLN